MARRISQVGLWVLVAVLLLGGSPSFAQRNLKEIPDPDPELERKTFQLPPGFEVNLFSADPHILKPIQMNFDARGRLWVASSEVYPQIKPGQAATDKILVLEDRDGDGRAETTTVFADGLLIPTGIEFGDDGVYVANSTEIIHLKDTDGDGKADQRRVVLSGFGTEDTHHIIHTFRFGMDGAMYFNQSIYIHSHVETPWGVRRLNAGGIWRFRPHNLKLEVFARGWINTWGHHFDEFGQSFVTDGAGGEGINYGFPGSVYPTAYNAKRVMKGLNPGSPKYCGAEIVSGEHLPADWRGNIITNDFRGHRVCRFVLSEDGSGYAAKEMPELIKSSHVAFRPIDIKMGPDGAIYIADWYNPIIQHGEVDFRDERRDHVHGRVWRVTYPERKLVARPTLATDTVPQLLERLKSTEQWTRHHARRVLTSRGASEVLPSLRNWLGSLPTDTTGDAARLEGLWTYQSFDTPEPALLQQMLKASDGRIRAAAVRVLSDWTGDDSTGADAAGRRIASGQALAWLRQAVADEFPRVRLEAVRALAALPSREAVATAVLALDRPMDRFLDFALWQTLRDRQSDWLPDVVAGKFDFQGKAAHSLFALLAAGVPECVEPIVRLIDSGRIPEASLPAALGFVGTEGRADDLAFILDLSVKKAGALPSATPNEADTAIVLRLLTSLNQAMSQRRVRPSGELASLARLFSHSNANIQVAAIRLAGQWREESFRPALTQLATTTGADTVRQAAFEGLVALGRNESMQLFDRLTNSSTPGFDARIALEAVAAWASLDLDRALPRAIILLETLKQENPTRVFEAILSQKEGPPKLASALAGKVLSEDVAKVGLRMARTVGRGHEGLQSALITSGKIATGVKQLSPSEMEAMVAAVRTTGDAKRGEHIFRRADMNCLKCHAIRGAGGIVGPDLGSLGATAQIDYLVDSMLVPNKAVKENFHSLNVLTTAGKVVTGIKVRRTEKELVLRNAEDQEVTLAPSQIEEESQGISLMPAGLVDPLTRGELVDLVRFMSDLGRSPELAPTQARLVRRWQTLGAQSPAWKRLSSRSSLESVLFDGRDSWETIYSHAQGMLPIAELPLVRDPATQAGVSVARFQVEATTAGPVEFVVGSKAVSRLWLNRDAVAARTGAESGAVQTFPMHLAVGTQTITIAVDRTAENVGELRIELRDTANSPAVAQIISGK